MFELMKNKTIGVTIFVLTASAAGSFAHAGNEGHGGNVVVCDANGPVGPFVLDYYDATLKSLDGTAPDLIDISSFTTQQVIDLARKKLQSRLAFLQNQFEPALSGIGPIGKWKSANLKQMDDSAEPYVLPAGCRKTAANRQDPYVMFGDPNVIGTLSEAQKGVLVLHEVFYAIAAGHGQQNSSKVRPLIKAILEKNPKDLGGAIGGIGGDPTDFQDTSSLLVGNYQPEGRYGFKGYDVQVDQSTGHILLNTTDSDWGANSAEFDCSLQSAFYQYLTLDDQTTSHRFLDHSKHYIRCKIVATNSTNRPELYIATEDGSGSMALGFVLETDVYSQRFWIGQ